MLCITPQTRQTPREPMRKSTFIPTALVAAGLLACVGSARALATATASLSNF